MSINFDKIKFLKREVSYLGMKLNSKRITPNTDRVNSFNFVNPQDKKQLMKLIGLLNWFRPFIKNLSGRIHQFTEKLKKQNKFSWNDNDKRTVRKLIDEIQSEILLYYPDPEKEFQL